MFITNINLQFIMAGNYFGEGYNFKLIGKIPVSIHADACFQLATNTGTGEEYFFVQEQAGKSAGRPYRKQGLIIPATSIPYYKKKEEECIKQFYAMARISYDKLDDLR